MVISLYRQNKELNDMSRKILLIDDEVKILSVVKSYLVKEGYEVITATEGREGLEKFYLEKPDMAVIDLMLPDISGEEICASIRKISEIPVIMLTAKSGEENIVRGLNCGADDYVTKPFGTKELVARIKSAERRAYGKKEDVYTSPDARLTINYDKQQVYVENSPVNLTAGEYRILEKMSKKPGRVFSREELLNVVSGNDTGAFDRTIDAHIKNLRAKIEKESKSPEYIITVFGSGYKFGG